MKKILTTLRKNVTEKRTERSHIWELHLGLAPCWGNALITKVILPYYFCIN